MNLLISHGSNAQSRPIFTAFALNLSFLVSKFIKNIVYITENFGRPKIEGLFLFFYFASLQGARPT